MVQPINGRCLQLAGVLEDLLDAVGAGGHRASYVPTEAGSGMVPAPGNSSGIRTVLSASSPSPQAQVMSPPES